MLENFILFFILIDYTFNNGKIIKCSEMDFIVDILKINAERIIIILIFKVWLAFFIISGRIVKINKTKGLLK